MWFSEGKSDLFDQRPYDSLHRPDSAPWLQGSAGRVQTEGLDQDRLKQDILDETRKELSQKKSSLMQSSRKWASQMLPRETKER